MRKKHSSKKKFSIIKKTIKDFIVDEEGFIKKETILKIGLGTISALGLLSSFANLTAAHSSHASHVNTSFTQLTPIPSTNCQRLTASHNSHSSHASHSSY